MTNETIIERLKTISEEIESDRYTMEQIDKLIEDIETSNNLPF